MKYSHGRSMHIFFLIFIMPFMGFGAEFGFQTPTSLRIGSMGNGVVVAT